MRKTFLLILALFLIITPLLASCNNEPKEESKAEASQAVQLKKADLDGREIKIYCWDFGYGSSSILGYTGEVIYNEENPSAVDSQKEKVLHKVEEEYNCKISGVKYGVDYDTFGDNIKNMIAAGTHEYDLVFSSYGMLAPLVLQNTFLNLKDISTIDFSNDWWDQRANADLSINNKLFFTCGDINTYDNDGTWCVLFNKTLKNKLGITEDFYQLVRDDKWTFDKFTEIVKRNITQNTNQDDVLDEKDTWALGTERYNIYVHLVGGGDKIVSKNADDIPYFTYDNEKTKNSLSKILELYMDKSTVMVADASPYLEKGFPNVWEATVHKAFVEGRELFYICGLINVPSYRNMGDDFGILPIPKMTSEQDSYYHTVSCDNMTVMAIPSNVIDADELGMVIEALGYYSKKHVTPAYYDVQLKYRDTRDSESGEMLDLIFSTRSFDLGAAFNWGGTLTSLMTMDTNIASRFEAIADKADSELSSTLKIINDMSS